MGILHSLRPPALGGRTEKAREYFERAVELSEGRDLTIKVNFARYYARMVYDRDLHDRILGEVLEQDPGVPDLVLMNVLAKEQAEKLLKSAESYF